MATLLIVLCFVILFVIWAILFLFVAPMALPQLARGLKGRKNTVGKNTGA